MKCQMSFDHSAVLNIFNWTSSTLTLGQALRFPNLSLILICQRELVVSLHMNSVLAFAFEQLNDNPSLGREGKQGASLTEVVRFHLEDRRLSENGVTNESTILATQRAVSETGQRPSSNLVLPPWQGIKMSSANAVFYLSRPSIFVHNKHALGLSGKLSLGFNKKSFVQVHKKRFGSFTK